MYSFAVVHESRILKQARPKGQYVDLLRITLATPSWNRNYCKGMASGCQYCLNNPSSLLYNQRKHLLFDKLNPVEYPGLKRAGDPYGNIALFVYIDNVSAVADGGVYFSVLIRLIP